MLFSKHKNAKCEDQNKGSFQTWLGIKEIQKNKICLIDGKQLILLKVSPINFKLRSTMEQKAILDAYKLFLKNLNSKVQIVISTKRTNVSDHIEEIYKFTRDNPQLQEMCLDYIDLIKSITAEKGSITKEFYIVIEKTDNYQNDSLKIIEYLSSCGNEVEEASRDDVISLLKNYINKRIECLVS